MLSLNRISGSSPFDRSGTSELARLWKNLFPKSEAKASTGSISWQHVPHVLRLCGRALSRHDRQQQGHRADFKCHPDLAAAAWCRMALDRPGQTDAEWLRRELQRAHTNRVRSTPQGGAKLEQALLMNEDKLGSRSSRPHFYAGYT
jgi:hypothetical protein